jgi:hypothetical protein
MPAFYGRFGPPLAAESMGWMARLIGVGPVMLDGQGNPYSAKSVIKHRLIPVSRLVTGKISMVQGIGRQ